MRENANRPRPSRAGGAPKVYPNIKLFHQRRGSARSAESDYGCGHHDDYSALGGKHRESVRVSYVHDTGDLYAIDESSPENSRIALLGTLAGHDGTPMSPERVSEVLNGWMKHPGPGRPLSWFVNRMKEAARNGGDAHAKETV